MIEMRKADQRGVANLGWLRSFHTFSFASYWDPEQVGFSDLLVINDDRVSAAKVLVLIRTGTWKLYPMCLKERLSIVTLWELVLSLSPEIYS